MPCGGEAQDHSTEGKSERICVTTVLMSNERKDSLPTGEASVLHSPPPTPSQQSHLHQQFYSHGECESPSFGGSAV